MPATSKAPTLVYADGSCLGNPGGPGGWGVVIVTPSGTHRLSGGDSQTTNNRMEIMAAIEALRALDPGVPVIIRSDSQYLVRTMNDGWRRTKNQDLWQELDREVARHDVRFEWVRGHAGDALNEEADALAREAARERGQRPRSQPPRSSRRRVWRRDRGSRAGALRGRRCGGPRYSRVAAVARRRRTYRAMRRVRTKFRRTRRVGAA